VSEGLSDSAGPRGSPSVVNAPKIGRVSQPLDKIRSIRLRLSSVCRRKFSREGSVSGWGKRAGDPENGVAKTRSRENERPAGQRVSSGICLPIAEVGSESGSPRPGSGSTEPCGPDGLPNPRRKSVGFVHLSQVRRRSLIQSSWSVGERRTAWLSCVCGTRNPFRRPCVGFASWSSVAGLKKTCGGKSITRSRATVVAGLVCGPNVGLAGTAFPALRTTLRLG